MRKSNEHSIFASLRHKNYRYLWISNVLGRGGLWVQQTTLAWLVWKLSGSATIVGITAGLWTLPFLFIGPFSGVLADKIDRRRLLMVTTTLMAVIAVLFAVVVAMDWVQVWHAVLFSLLMGCGSAIFMPVSQALIANTVPREGMPNAIALSALAFNTSRVLGPALGGILIVTLGAAGNFLLQAGLFLSLVVILLPMKTPYRDTETKTEISLLKGLREGGHYIWNDKSLFALIILSFIPSFFVIPITQLLPAFTDLVLRSEANTYGYLMASFGIGGVLATLILASSRGSTRNGWLGIISLASATSFLILLSQARVPWIAFLLVPFIGLSMMLFRVNNNTLVQILSPDRLRGRITSIYLVDRAMIPFASFVLGAIADLFSVSVAIEFSGVVGLLSLIALMCFAKPVRDIPKIRIQDTN